MDFKKEIKKLYNIEIANITSLSGGWVNEKYLITCLHGEKYVLKELSMNKFPKNHFNVVCETVNLQKRMYDNGLLVPNVISNMELELITIFSNSKYYFLQEYIFGKKCEFNEFNLSEIKSIALNLAILHKYLLGIPIEKFQSSFLEYKNINILKKEFNDRLNEINEDTNIEYKREISRQDKIIKNIENSQILLKQELQLIHGDFTPDNIIINNNNVSAFIDFELCRVNTRLQDVGRIILSLCLTTNGLSKEKLNSFLQGYSSICEITVQDIVDAIKFVWINEVNLWIREKYFRNYNPPKVNKFIYEIQWISMNWFDLENIIKDVLNYEKCKSKLWN